jgi:hypothetical protein
LLRKLINELILLGIMSHMPQGDWKQLANKRPSWIQRNIEEAFWWFVDQNECGSC